MRKKKKTKSNRSMEREQRNTHMQTVTIELPQQGEKSDMEMQLPQHRSERVHAANLPQKRKRISKFRFYFINIVLGLIITIILAVMLIYSCCRISTVTIDGNTVYADEDVKNAILNDTYSFNSVYVYLKSLIKPVENVPFIESYSITLDSPTAITIHVKEKEMLACVMASDGTNYVYFDDDGVVQELSTLTVNGVMLISGITVDDPQQGETLNIDSDALKALLSLTKNLKKYEITASAIYFNESGDLFITYGDSIQIDFGNSNYMAEKVMRLTYILPKLEGMAGTLHLEDWNEENTDIVFEKVQ